LKYDPIVKTLILKKKKINKKLGRKTLKMLDVVAT
jgi:hypothetical protein